MKISILLVLIAILCGVNGKCEVLFELFNITTGAPPTVSETSTSNLLPATSTPAIEPVNSTGKVTSTSNSIPPTTPLNSDSVNDVNGFTKLYLALRSYHENELRKTHARYDQLEEFLRKELYDVRFKNSLLESKMRDLESRTVNNAAGACASISQTENHFNRREDSDMVMNKLEHQRMSNGCNCNAELQVKVDQIYEKLLKMDEKNVQPLNSDRFCDTKDHKTENTNIDDIIQPTINTTIIDILPYDEVKMQKHKKYLGCYQDRQENRLLKGVGKHIKFNSMEVCTDACLAENYVYAGMEGNWCRCDNEMPYKNMSDFHLNDSSCNIHCPGNTSQTCGGTGYIFSLYVIGQLSEALSEDSS